MCIAISARTTSDVKLLPRGIHVFMNQMLCCLGGVHICGFHQGSPPSFCPPSRTQDLEAILSIISEAQHFIHVAVMEYFPTTRFEKPRR